MKMRKGFIATGLAAGLLLDGTACSGSSVAAKQENINREFKQTARMIARGLIVRMNTHNAGGIPDSIGSHLQVKSNTLSDEPNKVMIVGVSTIRDAGGPSKYVEVTLSKAHGSFDATDGDSVSEVRVSSSNCTLVANKEHCVGGYDIALMEDSDGNWFGDKVDYSPLHQGTVITDTDTSKLDEGVARTIAENALSGQLAILKQQ